VARCDYIGDRKSVQVHRGGAQCQREKNEDFRNFHERKMACPTYDTQVHAIGSPGQLLRPASLIMGKGRWAFFEVSTRGSRKSNRIRTLVIRTF
jgi:hypothetical protein